MKKASMKYSKTGYFEMLNVLKERLTMAIEFQDKLVKRFYNSDEYKNASNRIAEGEAQIKEFQKEHYSDFRVYTNNERARDVRIDGLIMRRDATLN